MAFVSLQPITMMSKPPTTTTSSLSSLSNSSSTASSSWLSFKKLACSIQQRTSGNNNKSISGRRVVCLRGSGNSDTTVQTRPTQDASVAFGRQSFPPGFVFGAATAAYQIEGAWNEGGRGPSIWDTFTQQQPHKIVDRSDGNIAVDSYHRYKEDVQLLKDMNLDAYRFSISWSRILPKGSLKGGINPEGIKYYNNLINELLKNGITPYVTLFHWDVPQALEDEYGGFLSKKIMNDFKDYCEVCFKEYGDRVKHWITLNEPWTFSSMGYGTGWHAPGRCSSFLGCPVGDSIVEPYIVTHNSILAHGAAAKLYKDQYQKNQGGQIGITLVSMWFEPYDNTHRDKEAANRALDSMIAWYMDPLVHGDYPFSIKSIVRERLPRFSKEEEEMIKGSFDFIGINYYTARYAKDVQFSHEENPILHINESFAEQLEHKDEIPIGESNGSWIYVVPHGLRNLLLHIKNRYDNPTVYITENGISTVEKNVPTKDEIIADEIRKNYLALHLAEIQEAIRDGANIKAYFAWSLMDNFEWQKGFTERFGLNHVDFNTLDRTPKESAKWFSKFVAKA